MVGRIAAAVLFCAAAAHAQVPKQAVLEESVLPRDVVEAAAAYMAAEDSPLAVAYSGWAQCALPHRKTPNEALWVVESDRVRLVIEPGHKASGRKGDGPM